jgi:glucokinase
VLAFDVGGTTIKAEVLDPDLEPLGVGSVPTPYGDPAAAHKAIRELGRSLLDGLPARRRSGVARVGLAVPGIVDLANGTAVFSANLGWRDVQVAAPVRAAFGLPVVVSHDVTAAGLAEWRRGAGRGVDDLLVVVIGTGIAAVIVVGGRIVRGGLQQAGELGHLVVQPGGPMCNCGQRGCVEVLASARAVARTYAAATGRAVEGAVTVHSRLGTDTAADAAWDQAVDALADGLLAACTLLAPVRVVIGGGLANAGNALLDPLRARLVDKARVAAVPELVTAALGERAGLVGAALFARGGTDP